MRSERGAAGYSLIEVIISLGILTGVIVAIASMFVLAQTTVKSGKLLTQATSIGEDMMEDINKLSYNGLQVYFVGTQNLATLTSYTADTRTAGSYAATTYANIIKAKLWKGYALITLTPIGGNVKPAVWNSGEAIRVSITIFWTELRRNRSVTVEGVRF